MPDPTIPETTQSVIPTAYVPAEEMLKGSVIEMTVEEDTILLSECDLTLEMTTGSNLVYRKGYVAAVMKSEPIIHEGVVYLHEDFFQMYLRREDSDPCPQAGCSSPIGSCRTNDRAHIARSRPRQ